MHSPPEPDDHGDHLPVDCDACQTALRSPNRQTVSFLLVDQYTVPVVGCEDHLEQFATICGLTTPDTAQLLSHLPAGGIQCPSCRLARHSSQQVLIPVGDGAAGILACEDHMTTMATRFKTGLETKRKLLTDIERFQ